MAVPVDASMIFHLEKPFEQWSDITNNKIWNYLKTIPYIDSINTEMENNSTLWELVIGRPIVISVHPTRPNDYDFLYTIDLQGAAQFDFVKNFIEDLSIDIHKVGLLLLYSIWMRSPFSIIKLCGIFFNKGFFYTNASKL